MVSPQYSIMWPLAPAAPSLPMIASAMSLAVVPKGSAPLTSTFMFRGFCCNSVCVASTCSTSDAPMPKASAPSAPWVEACESPLTIVWPGSEKPSSGPMTWTMPCRTSSTGI